MNPPASASPWQPLTFGGVATFAGGTLWRFVTMLAIMAATVTIATVWFLLVTCFPVLDQAAGQLPEQGAVQYGRLIWSGPSPQVLGENAFVALAVNASEARSPGTTADLEILLTPEGVRFSSLLGQWTLPYIAGWGLDLRRRNLESWWDAWRWALVVGILVFGTAGLMVLWSGLALITGIPVRILGQALGRSLTKRGAWQLAVAAGFPGSLVLTTALVLYGLGRFSLLGLLLAYAVRWLILGLYLFAAPWRLPRRSTKSAAGANPFSPAKGKPRRGPGRRNPFAGSR